MDLTTVPMTGFAVEANVENFTCDNGKGRSARVRVAWSSALPAIASVRILTVAPDGSSKIWVEGGPIGEDTTGPWIEDGARLELVDAQSQQPLAQVTARSAACGR